MKYQIWQLEHQALTIISWLMTSTSQLSMMKKNYSPSQMRKLQENISSVKCPDPKCRGLLEPHCCRDIIPQEVFDRWENALCESLVLGSQKFYCPYKDCSAMLVDDGGEVVTASECPDCRRLFCAQCRVSWHAGIECRVFQNLNKDEREREDIMVMELAKKKNWRRCPHCKFYVDKVQGCLQITCRLVYYILFMVLICSLVQEI